MIKHFVKSISVCQFAGWTTKRSFASNTAGSSRRIFCGDPIGQTFGSCLVFRQLNATMRSGSVRKNRAYGNRFKNARRTCPWTVGKCSGFLAARWVAASRFKANSAPNPLRCISYQDYAETTCFAAVDRKTTARIGPFTQPGPGCAEPQTTAQHRAGGPRVLPDAGRFRSL